MLACYAVFGNPVAHSQSPLIHQLFAEQEGITINYERITIDDETLFADALTHFFANGGRGANITVPYKEKAFLWAKQVSDRAKAAQAANTLIRTSTDDFLADNTDGVGLVQDITEHLGLSLHGKSILILGAGGASRGVILPLLSQQPAVLFIANRTHTKAKQLAKHFGIGALTISELAQQKFDLIINATSSSLYGNNPDIPNHIFQHCTLAYDMVYGVDATPFMQRAQQYGTKQIADGLGMLVCQAAESYRLWRGFLPHTAPVIHTMRNKLSL